MRVHTHTHTPTTATLLAGSLAHGEACRLPAEAVRRVCVPMCRQSLALQKGLCSEDPLVCVLLFSEAEGMVEYDESGHL